MSSSTSGSTGPKQSDVPIGKYVDEICGALSGLSLSQKRKILGAVSALSGMRLVPFGASLVASPSAVPYRGQVADSSAKKKKKASKEVPDDACLLAMQKYRSTIVDDIKNNPGVPDKELWLLDLRLQEKAIKDYRNAKKQGGNPQPTFIGVGHGARQAPLGFGTQEETL